MSRRQNRLQQLSPTAMMLVVLLLSTFAGAQAGDDQQVQSDQQALAPTVAAPAATGPNAGEAQNSQFPPLSGLDEGTLEPNAAARSYIVPGALASESLDTNPGNNLNGKGGTRFIGVTHLLGDVALQRLWSHYQTALSYVGGGALYAGSVRSNAQMHELSFDSRVLWRTGALIFRDSASYLPEGTFGGGLGTSGVGLEGIGGLPGGGLGAGIGGSRFGVFGAGMFGALGTAQYLSNLSILEAEERFSPRTSFTMAGGYRYLHFIHNPGNLLVDSRQITGQAGYNYLLDRHNQIAVIYAFQRFSFPVVGLGNISSNSAQLVYGHQISGRMNFVVGAGPQFTRLSSAAQGVNLRVSVSGRASLRYKFTRSTLMATYDRFDAAGSGFYTGASTDIARLSLSRPLSRRWEVVADVGYAHSHRLQPFTTTTAGVSGNSYQTGLAGARVNRVLTRSLHGFLFYQFNELAFDRGFCGSFGTCSRISSRHAFGIGLRWLPRPYRLD